VLVEDPNRKECLRTDARISFKHPSPSPDGRWLAWFSDEGSPGHFHLWKGRLDAKLGRGIRLTNDPNRNDCHPTWSPDGWRIAFHGYMGAVDASVSHIFTCTAEGGDLYRLTGTDRLHKHPFFVGRNRIVHHTEERDGSRYLVLRAADGTLLGDLTRGDHNDKHPSSFVPRRGPPRICFASKKRGKTSAREGAPTYDIFWGVLR
jgi:Tol biopolymer transport system component